MSIFCLYLYHWYRRRLLQGLGVLIAKKRLHSKSVIADHLKSEKEKYLFDSYVYVSKQEIYELKSKNLFQDSKKQFILNFSLPLLILFKIQRSEFNILAMKVNPE